MTKQTHEFQAEVAKVLDIVIHSLYSHSEVFLRELISNASDACDKLRYALLMHPELAANAKDGFKIKLIPDKKAKTLTVSDNGIGMNEEDLIKNLGTIAQSGSAEFLKNLTGDKEKDVALIGQFGVGFYASFMVADKVVVKTKKAGDTKGYVWESDGAGTFSITEDDSVPFGTQVILHLKKDCLDYLEDVRLRYLVHQYSNHISLPVILVDGKKEETINEANALWCRPKNEITEQQYRDFYQNLTHAFDSPWMTLHYKAEGALEYTSLLFIPTKPPFNLFQNDRKSGLNLYVNRVFITDDMPELMPAYLRFISGVIDTKDLPLNVSREMLQKTPVLEKIKTGLVRRVLGELKKRAENKEDYATFWNSFGIVLKEGLYEPSDHRADLADLCRFYTTQGDELVDFKAYIARMPKKQKNIYYLTGTDLETLRHHPQLEGFIARGIEVLLLTDPVDEFWTQTFQEYDGKKLVSVMYAKDDLKDIPLKEDEKKEELQGDLQEELVKKAKEILTGEVAQVQMTGRLTKSPAVLITPEGQMSLNLERMMKAHGQTMNFASGRILELNKTHDLIKKLADLVKAGQKEDVVKDIIWLLYDQARIAEGEPLKDPAAFAGRLNHFLEGAL